MGFCLRCWALAAAWGQESCWSSPTTAAAPSPAAPGSEVQLQILSWPQDPGAVQMAWRSWTKPWFCDSKLATRAKVILGVIVWPSHPVSKL